MSGRRPLTFADLLQQRTWTDYSQFISEAPSVYAEEIRQHVREERELIRKLREHPDFKRLDVYKVDDRLAEVEPLLGKGMVVGAPVDSTANEPVESCLRWACFMR